MISERGPLALTIAIEDFMALSATAMRISKRVWQQHVPTPMTLGNCLLCHGEVKSYAGRWDRLAPSLLYLSCKILTSSKTRNTMIIVFWHESFRAGDIINKDSYVKLHWYVK